MRSNLLLANSFRDEEKKLPKLSYSYIFAAFGFWVRPDLSGHTDLFNFGDVILNTLYKCLSHKLSISR